MCSSLTMKKAIPTNEEKDLDKISSNQDKGLPFSPVYPACMGCTSQKAQIRRFWWIGDDTRKEGWTSKREEGLFSS